MIDTGFMKAGIELTGLQEVRGLIGTPQTQVCVDVIRDLLAGGGRGDFERIPDRDVKRYTFEGPPELVRPVIAAFMAFIKSTEDR